MAVAAASLVAAVAGACSSGAPEGEPLTTTSSADTAAIAGLFPTGVNAAGALLPSGTVDPHYVLSSSDPAFPGHNAVAVNANPAWIANTAGSKWISIRPNAMGAADATYTYTTAFTLTSVDPKTASLSGSWAADDSVILILNGTQVAAYPAKAYTALASFSVAAGGPFVLGTNTLAFATVNSGGGPTGLQIATIAGSVTGCALDSQCTPAQFCDTATFDCVAKIPNGMAVPTIAGHTPALTGLCSTAVGAAVCVSGACDTKDDACGLLNGDGPCTSVDGGAGVCRSGACDMDGACGYANGDGPCTPMNAGTVCRSGACSEDGNCEPAGGCGTDADCTGSTWCDESAGICKAKLANGQPVVDDPPHVNPTLDGTCTAAAAMLVCASAVCDTKDNDCGYANGDGPCTPADAGTVCRSGACSVNGTCEPMGGCNVNGDCPSAAAPDCNQTTHTCQGTLDAGVEAGGHDAGDGGEAGGVAHLLVASIDGVGGGG